MRHEREKDLRDAQTLRILERETWKDIPGFDGKYKASNMGKIMSFVNHNSRIVEYGHLLVPRISNCGYVRVSLTHNHKTKSYSVHRLILLAFVGKSKKQCNHKNGVKADNRIENLEYVTQGENIRHAYRHGLKNATGSRNGQAKLTEEVVLEIKKLSKIINIDKCASISIGKTYGVSGQAILDIKNGRRWGHIK